MHGPRPVRAAQGEAAAVHVAEEARHGDLRSTQFSPNLERLVLGGGGGGKPDYLQKLKVPEGYEKINDYSNI